MQCENDRDIELQSEKWINYAANKIKHAVQSDSTTPPPPSPPSILPSLALHAYDLRVESHTHNNNNNNNNNNNRNNNQNNRQQHCLFWTQLLSLHL